MKIAENIDKYKGAGIIYCLTKRDCKMVCDWLIYRGVNARVYYGGIDNKERQIIEHQFMNNEIDVLVATSAYGMGVDKADIYFVIHFQKPGNPIAYYQQIGRAGRGIERAHAILMSGLEDDYITRFFIESAFPTIENMTTVLNIIEKYKSLKRWQIVRESNIKQSKVEKCLKFLVLEKVVNLEKGNYSRTIYQWNPSTSEANEITTLRYKELDKMNEFVETTDCYMEFMALELDDPNSRKCNVCNNCNRKQLVKPNISNEMVNNAIKFLKQSYFVIEPRKKWPDGIKHNNRNIFIDGTYAQVGKVLSNYGDVAYGRLVTRDKYINKCFSDELVDASVNLLRGWINDNKIMWVSYVPSIRRPELVKSFAEKVARKLNLECYNSIKKKIDSKEQKTLKNSFKQYENAWNSFEVINTLPGNVLLIDNLVEYIHLP